MNEPTSSAAAASVRLCYRHPDTVASNTCSSCHRLICGGCLGVGTNLAPACHACVTSQRRQGQYVMLGALAAVTTVVVGIGAFIAAQPAPVPYGEHRAEITRLSARVDATPCDEQSTLELVELLNKERDYPRTITVVDAFRERCKPVPRLYWASYSARMQVQDFQGAVDDATRLMTNNPDDGDFVWWRAKAKRELGDVAGTEADLRRAAELAGGRAFWSILDLATLLETQHRECEAVPLLTQLDRNLPEESQKSSVPRRLARLIRETPCPDATAALPRDGDVAAVCATLPSALHISDDVSSGFEYSLKNSWAARTATVAKGEPVACRAEFAKLDVGRNSVLSGTGMESWSARLACTGHASTTVQTLHAVPLKAQEELVAKLVDESIRKWCGD